MARNQYVEINTAFCVPGLSTEEQQRLLAVCDVTPHPLSPELKEAVQDANLRGYIHLTSPGTGGRAGLASAATLHFYRR